jgi:hypothetical protein
MSKPTLWEYVSVRWTVDVEGIDFMEQELNKYGLDAWELINIVRGGTFYRGIFKRQLLTPVNRKNTVLKKTKK